jgi:hypothetical protein
MRKLILILPLLSFLMFSCKKEKPSVSAVLAALTTDSVTLITSTTAKSGGNITNDGGSPIISRGICWSNMPNESILGNHSIDGAGKGSFVSSLIGLTPGTQYFVRAYATNSVGTSYGNEVIFTCANTPNITTAPITLITSSTATSGGKDISDGNSPITQKGICWSEFPNPTITDFKTTEGTGKGSFTSNMTNLLTSKTYYVRAYATNSVGTSYGNELSFTTSKLKIGDNYQGGIVAYIDNSSIHGLIAAPADLDLAVFASNNVGVAGGLDNKIGTGNDNTNKIVAELGTDNNAARLCYDLTLGGYSDWYLPSKDELNEVFLNKDLIGGFAISGVCCYWSSSQIASQYMAWVQLFFTANAGYQSNGGLITKYRVRAIRTF